MGNITQETNVAPGLLVVNGLLIKGEARKIQYAALRISDRYYSDIYTFDPRSGREIFRTLFSLSLSPHIYSSTGTGNFAYN
jgi:hypothetical protein